MNKGWIKFHRELLEKAIWKTSTPEQKTILITLLGMANWKETQWEFKGEKFICKPGQFITSLKSIAEKAGPGVSIQNVRTALVRFEKLEFLTNESTKQNRLITIVNWAFYQDDDEQPNKDNNNQLTKSQQRPNNHLTTNKEIKNLRKKEILDDDEDAKPENPFDFYQNNFGVLNPFIGDDIGYWIDCTNETLVIAAMQIALKNNKTWNYAAAILKDWHKHNLKTPDDVKAYTNQKNRGNKKGDGKHQTDYEQFKNENNLPF